MNFIGTFNKMEKPVKAPLAGFPGKVFTHTTVEQNLHDGTLQAETIIALHNAVDLDIAFPMMDLTVEAEALGAKINWHIDELPAVTGIKVETIEDAEALVIPEIGVGNRLNVFVDTCSALKKAFPNKLVWAYVLGPFSIAGRLMGMTEIAIATKLEPELVHAVLGKCNTLLKKYIKALLDTGVDGLMVLEPASGMLNVDDANEFSNDYIKELVALIKSEGKTPSLHNCGRIQHLVESLCATGIEALHVGSVTDPQAIYPRVAQNVVLMGNLDPTEIFLRGTPESVREETLKLYDRMADCERFIISSGCDLPPGTPIENLKAFASTVSSRSKVTA
ncbi:uroporphyrinogen decarboxylase family protein [uncultured Desulfobulbus sp.]|uniref:uroporphyrinogen decarboxylase family protein n=1 Tax=uncultured Desulfobulbus sp. TaxID=239745 RepID=UPI0029C94C76|nr:uroporphyrinogen decarboxylase family protein [uncultured Desulfobulbus sp.]